MALDYLHVNHILHRDVKCSNIFLTKDHDIRLGDFGLAKMLTSDDLTSSVVGTPSYMCPELLADIPYGSKSDIWSLGCCIYEMTSLKPAFKAFDIQSLINKINKSIVAPLPTKYSGAFRGLVKSMLRKNPELRPSAAELLGHQHLQPYVLKVHLKINSPRRNTLPGHWPESNYIKKTRFLKSEADPVSLSGYKWHSFSNDRTLNPSVSRAEQDSLCSTLEIDCTTVNLNQRFAELCVGDNHDVKSLHKPAVSKNSSNAKTPKLTASKASATSKKLTVPSKNHKTLPVSHNTKQPVHTTRRVSLPLPKSCAIQQPPRRSSIGLLDHVNSPNISVNSPRIDRIAEFPLASYEDPLFPVNRSSPNSVQGSSGSPPCGNDSTLIDKCTIKVCDTAYVRPGCTDAWQGIKRSIYKSGSSDQNATAGASSHNSSDLHHRQFDTSSFQQRAEALEGLLEFSARLLQQERYGELGVLLKPFGPGKASPRETAIWLSKSFKENTFNREQSI
ncbi:serine/threonine-protein kinase Nek2 isoform X2 [Cajanus cajan]|nr:serine/threonine-protein kinase Nek2 isoform X2 [Cajanus cajan]